MKPLSKITAERFAPLHLNKSIRAIVALEMERQESFHCNFFTTYKDLKGQEQRQYVYDAMGDFAQRIPGHKKVYTRYGKGYEFPASDNTVDLFQALWQPERIEFEDDFAQLVWQSILVRGEYADKCAEMVARWREEKTLPVDNLECSADYPLSDYQALAQHICYHSPGYSLYMEQGTGKTPVIVSTICNLARDLQAKIQAENLRPRMFLGIVCAPNNVRLNWEKEFQKFATRPGKVTILRGTEIDRIKQIIDATRREEGCDYSIIVSGYDTISSSTWDALKILNFDIAVLDESHYIKSSRTKRWEYAQKLRDISDKRICLTGTPVTNSALDLYTQLEFTGKGYSGFNSFDSFRRFYGVFEQGQGGERLVGVQNLPFMQERLARYSFVVRKEEVLPDLPEKQYDIYEVEMSDEQTQHYKQLASQLAIEIEADMKSGGNLAMTVNNTLTKLLRLAQITSGFLVLQDVLSENPEKHLRYLTPNPKIEAIRELMAEKGPNDKTIIWACWTADIDYICHALRCDGIEFVEFTGRTKDAAREQAEYRFNNDDSCKVFVGNAAAGGTGLNLLGYPPGNPEASQCNANHIVYYSQNWSSTARSQSEDRANRRGTRVPTRITDLVCPQTIDEEIRTRVVDKRIHAWEVSDLKELLKAALGLGNF